jgi:hypothetical protein
MLLNHVGNDEVTERIQRTRLRTISLKHDDHIDEAITSRARIVIVMFIVSKIILN